MSRLSDDDEEFPDRAVLSARRFLLGPEVKLVLEL
jgi:hypothetical protein